MENFPDMFFLELWIKQCYPVICISKKRLFLHKEKQPIEK